MNIHTFRAFVKEATALRADSSTPPDYLATKLATLARFPKLAQTWHHLSDLAGLGVLGVPAVQHLRGKSMSEGNKSKFEIAGLGLLAAPVAHNLITHNKQPATGILSRIASGVARAA